MFASVDPNSGKFSLEMAYTELATVSTVWGVFSRMTQVLSLLAYADPYDSPVSYLLQPGDAAFCLTREWCLPVTLHPCLPLQPLHLCT